MTFFNLQNKIFFVISALLLLYSNCNKTGQSNTNKNWKLVWNDEFDGQYGTLPDATKWTFDIGGDGWGNEELQYYTQRTNNVSLDGNGYLVITAKKETYLGKAYTSARIKTKGLFHQSYGRFEARLKTPYGPGLWPAFWLLGNNIDEVPWPGCGEIDIMELRGQKPNIISGTIHGPGYSGGNAKTKSYSLPQGRFDTDFHLFAVEWDENTINFFVDSYLYYSINKNNISNEWVFNKPFFILLNVAVGGNYVGYPTTATLFPQTMLVDYVRVYQ